MFNTIEQAEAIYNLGEMLIRDDAQDIFYTTYKHRTGHRYHGKKNKTHESPYHHYQLGFILALIGQVGGVLAQAEAMKNDLDLNMPEVNQQS
jgi:hypothetical protein